MASNVSYKSVILGVCLMLINAPTTQAGWLGAIMDGVAAVVVAPVHLPAIGLTSAAGSYATSLMSTAAVANGGRVASMAAGGGVTSLQSAAAGGAGRAILAAIGIAVGVVGAAVGAAVEDED